MKKTIEEETDNLTFNLNVVITKLQSQTLSTAGAIAAEELARTLIKIRDFISDESKNEQEKFLVITKLPLLYFQIPKLN